MATKAAGILDRALNAVKGAETAQDMQARIGELNSAIISAQATLAALEGERNAKLSDWLAKREDKAADANGQAIIAAKDTITTLEQRRAQALAGLHAVTVERDAAELAQRWAEVRKLMAERQRAVADLQKLADALAKKQDQVFALSQEVWDAVPEKPASRPQLFGNDLFKRLNMYIFGITEGKLGTGAVSPAVARKQPDLVSIDTEVQKILLLPLQKSMS